MGADIWFLSKPALLLCGLLIGATFAYMIASVQIQFAAEQRETWIDVCMVHTQATEQICKKLWQLSR